MISAAIDIDLLRAFVTVCRLGALSRAAGALGRTQSAMSMQMRRLEDLSGHRLLRRTGRGVLPTAEGEIFLGYAIRILALGDEAAARLNEPALDGAVRVGLPEEIVAASLPAALGRFRRAHPDVRLDVLVANSATLEPLWRQGELDVMVAAPSAVPSDAVATWSVGLRWICGLDYAPDASRPLDLVVFAEPCAWRARMFEALTSTGVAYRVAFTSSSVAAVQAAVESGLGVAVLTLETIRPGAMRTIRAAPGLPDSLVVQYGLYARSERAPAVEAVVGALLSERGDLHAPFSC